MANMSKEFALLKASRQLENYLSRERYNLKKMSENHRVTDSLYNAKVNHYNELVRTLNDLFGSMIGQNDGDEGLFTFYGVVDEIPEPDTYLPPEPSPKEELELEQEDDAEENEDVLEKWQEDGYESYEAWLAAKEEESVNQKSDLDIPLNTELTKQRMGDALSEYESTVESDISKYDPEKDPAPSVLDRSSSDVDQIVLGDGGSLADKLTDDLRFERPTENLDYLTHTADDSRLDKDPTQIVDVETAVEKDGSTPRSGITIDVKNFTSRKREDVIVQSIIDEEIDKVVNERYGATSRNRDTDDTGENDESVDDEDEDDDDSGYI